MYRHTQTGWLMIVVLPLVGLLAGMLCWWEGVPGAGLAILALLGLTLSQCFRMTVTVRDGKVVVTSGTGHLGWTVDLADVESCEPVTNRWWYGWGVKLLPWGFLGGPSGWLVNVSGFEAVELRYKEGGVLRIGTDEPWQLADAVQAELERLRAA